MEDTNDYFGVIELSGVSNKWQEGIPKVTSLELDKTHVTIVHYPDCQQMIIMLPTYGYNYEDMIIYNALSNEVIWSLKVRDYLMGDIKIIIDSTSTGRTNNLRAYQIRKIFLNTY
jgi:hypothetical protein